MSYDDGETPITRLAWVDEWIARGDWRSANACAWQRVAELRRLPAEELAAIPDVRWRQVIGWIRSGLATPPVGNI